MCDLLILNTASGLRLKPSWDCNAMLKEKDFRPLLKEPRNTTKLLSDVMLF